MKVLVDTNVIIDALQSRKGFLEDAGEIMLRAGDYDGFIAASSVTDIFYLQSRFFHDKAKARKNLADLLKIFEILDVTDADCRNALRGTAADYEDAVLMEVALRSGVEVIVTRNEKDFTGSAVKVCGPERFLEMLAG